VWRRAVGASWALGLGLFASPSSGRSPLQWVLEVLELVRPSRVDRASSSLSYESSPGKLPSSLVEPSSREVEQLCPVGWPRHSEGAQL
jgi:hypothetical protein